MQESPPEKAITTTETNKDSDITTEQLAKTIPKGWRMKDKVAQQQALSGPFPDSVPCAVQDMYERFLCTEHSRETLVPNTIPTFNAANETVRQLEVGDIILIYDSVRNNHTQFTCYDFTRFGIIVSATLNTIGIDTINEGTVFRQRNGVRLQIENADALWVKRNPTRTRALYEQHRAEYIALNIKNRELQEASQSNLKCTVYPETWIVRGVDGQGEDPFYRRLIDLPYDTFLLKQHVPGYSDAIYKNEIECFICHRKIKLRKNAPTDWDEIAKSGGPYPDAWKTHCAQYHAEQTFHFLLKLPIQNPDYHDVTMQVQKMLRGALEAFPDRKKKNGEATHSEKEHALASFSNGAFALNVFIALKENKNKSFLLYDIAMVMGYAIGMNASVIAPMHIAKLSSVKKFAAIAGNKTDTVKGSIQVLRENADAVLDDINHRLQVFDWVYLSEQMTAHQLWNAVHLFFKRGLLCTIRFPPIIGLNIPNYVISHELQMVGTDVPTKEAPHSDTSHEACVV